MRKQEETATDIARMSEGMKKSIKVEIAKFPQYYDFLFSVKAMGIGTGKFKNPADNFVVKSYPEDRMEEYRAKFVKPHEKDLNDAFMFEKWARSERDFLPKMFWDRAKD